VKVTPLRRLYLLIGHGGDSGSRFGTITAGSRRAGGRKLLAELVHRERY
jgi:hypothetical protein